MLREQGEGRHQESEVKDLRKAPPRSLHLNSMFGGVGVGGVGKRDCRPTNTGALSK